MLIVLLNIIILNRNMIDSDIAIDKIYIMILF